MENMSKKRKLEVIDTPMHERVPFGFPLRRRSHLKSETFSTLVRILSICGNESDVFHDLHIVSDAPNPGTGSEELERVTHRDAQIEKLSTENDPVTNQIAEVIGIESSSSSLGKEVSVQSAALFDKTDDKLGVSQIVVEESVQGAEVETNQQSFSFDVLEATQSTEVMEIDKQLNGGTLEESTQVDTQTMSLVQNAMDELAKEIQEKETDLEKPVNMKTSEEVEDGEIPDDSWDTDLSFDMFLEDAALINEMNLGDDQIPAKQGELHDVCRDKKPIDVMPSTSTSYDTVELKKSEGEFHETRKLQQVYGDEFLLDARKNNKKCDETRGSFNFPVTYADNLLYPVKTSEKPVTANEGIMSADMDSEVREKKKRGPRTKEYKANKKKKERKKRAIKERQQGVKRLRIQPIIKPKVVKYCEFYLNGRCQKGDACKFSHDTTPLTKSQPCKFLALQSCLKGDSCPFDHQLFKYPCNNMITKGTCHRGDACLFSHKPVEGAAPSNISQTDLESQLQPLSGFTSTRKPQNSKNTSFQNPKNMSKETTVGAGSQSHPEQKVLGRSKPPAQPPKGITLLSFGKSSLNEFSNWQQGDIPCNKDKGEETRNLKDQNTPSKGITLLSFGKLSMNQSSNRLHGDSPCNKDKGIETRNPKDQDTSPKGITLLSFGTPSANKSSNQQQGGIPCNKEKGIETRTLKDQNTSEKPQSSNSLLWKSPSNPVPLSQSSNPISSWQNTNTTDSIQKRLLSTLSFAAKHESETKAGQSICSHSMIPVEAKKTPSDVVEATKTPRSDSSSGSANIPKELKNASPVLLEFLFGSSGNR